MKHLKLFLSVVFIALLQMKVEANYNPKITVLIDKDLDYQNRTLFPQSCEILECPICCGGIPPSCSEE